MCGDAKIDYSERFNLRGTGRTARMLAEALRLNKAGRAVYVIVEGTHMAREFRRMLDKQSPGHAVQFETEASLPNFHWHTVQLRGAHANCVVLVDHWVIERRFRRVLAELHRFDS